MCYIRLGVPKLNHFTFLVFFCLETDFLVDGIPLESYEVNHGKANH